MMSIRGRLEKLEHELLCEYASKSDESKGRDRPISTDALRTEYQRDRDRIVHCKSFRRLKHKTQMFFAQDGEYYRTRLTHTMEVSQLARTLARSLRLNEDLAEAIALGHDLGHTPFGHTGERILERITGHFVHNEQSLRVVERLENGEGLNLTWEVRDGILNHSGGMSPATLEGECVHLADRIAYINHDIDDALRYGLISNDDLPAPLLNVLGDTHGKRIETMVLDIVNETLNMPHVSMSAEVGKATDSLRDFMFERVYSMSIDKYAEAQAGHILTHLFEYYRDNMDFETDEPINTQISDLISDMTDAYAVNTYKNLFIPEPWR